MSLGSMYHQKLLQVVSSSVEVIRNHGSVNSKYPELRNTECESIHSVLIFSFWESGIYREDI